MVRLERARAPGGDAAWHRATSSAAPIAPKRRLDELNHGTPASLASRAISRASSSVAASGLSMNSGLCAAITGRACSRCTRPSTLSSSTASTLESSVAMSGTISTPYLRADLLGVLLDAVDALLDILAAALVGGHHARARDVIRRVGSPFSSLVKAGTCEVSVPMMPTRRSAAGAQRRDGKECEDWFHVRHCTLGEPRRMDLTTPLTYVKGVGPARAAMLEAKGLITVEDLLGYVPFRYEDRSNMKTDRASSRRARWPR